MGRSRRVRIRLGEGPGINMDPGPNGTCPGSIPMFRHPRAGGDPIPALRHPHASVDPIPTFRHPRAGGDPVPSELCGGTKSLDYARFLPLAVEANGFGIMRSHSRLRGNDEFWASAIRSRAWARSGVGGHRDVPDAPARQHRASRLLPGSRAKRGGAARVTASRGPGSAARCGSRGGIRSTRCISHIPSGGWAAGTSSCRRGWAAP